MVLAFADKKDTESCRWTTTD